jgi:hypothetical protein
MTDGIHVRTAFDDEVDSGVKKSSAYVLDFFVGMAIMSIVLGGCVGTLIASTAPERRELEGVPLFVLDFWRCFPLMTLSAAQWARVAS